MAKIDENLAIIVAEQSGEGSVDTGVRDATSITTSNGIRTIDDSIAFSVERIQSDVPNVEGSLSRQSGDFLRPNVSLAFDIDLKGPGTASPSADTDYQLPSPIEAVLKGAGLSGASWSDGVGFKYSLTTPSFLTFKVWRNDQSWTLQDCRCNIEFSYTPGQKGTATVNVLVGSVAEHDNSDTFPTSVDYGAQATTKAPALKNAGSTVEGVSKGFLEGTISLDNQLETFPDSNAADGVIIELAGRSVDTSFQYWADDSDSDQEYTRLTATDRSGAELDFTLGTEGDSAEANALRFRARAVQFTNIGSEQQGERVVWSVDGFATGFYSPDTELEVISL